MIDRLQAARARFWVVIVPIVIGVFLLILAGMGIFYLQQQRDRDSLDEQLDQLRSLVASPVVISEELKENYDEALEAVKPEPELETGDVVLDILSIATDNGFDITQDVTITSNDAPRSENIGGTNYQVLTFELKVSGESNRVTDFVSDVDSTLVLQKIPLVIEDLDIDIASDTIAATLHFGVYVLKE